MNRQDNTDEGRRRLLIAALAGLVAAGLGGCGAAMRNADPAALAVDWPAAMVGDRDGARRFGAAYLRDFPAERDPATLLAALASALRRHDMDGQPFSQALLLRTVSGEYRRGEIVKVDGWLLSRSEARLYAAASLLH
jgi:hypothetical protein